MATTFSQVNWRIYNDDGGANTATPKAAEQTPFTVQPATQNVRVRIQVRVNSTPTIGTFTLYYSRNGGAYAIVPTSGGTYLNASDSSYYSNQAAATQRLTSPIEFASYVAGSVQDTGVVSTSIGVSVFTECEWCIKFTKAAIGSTFTFHARPNPGDTAITYTSIPSITVIPLVNLRVSGNKLRVSGNALRISNSHTVTLTFTTPGTFNFKVLKTVTMLTSVETYGAGGGGYIGTSGSGHGGGAGGGGYSKAVNQAVTPDSTISLTVGAGGAYGPSGSVVGSPFDGGDSSFGALCVAKGGKAGGIGSGGLGGDAAAGTGSTKTSGGNGGAGYGTFIGGGGGASGNPLANGNNASGTYGEVGGLPANGGGGGAEGGSSAKPDSALTNAGLPGGGGGGGPWPSSTGYGRASSGRDGKVIITFTN
jgi:hypothetical protein